MVQLGVGAGTYKIKSDCAFRVDAFNGKRQQRHKIEKLESYGRPVNFHELEAGKRGGGAFRLGFGV